MSHKGPSIDERTRAECNMLREAAEIMELALFQHRPDNLRKLRHCGEFFTRWRLTESGRLALIEQEGLSEMAECVRVATRVFPQNTSALARNFQNFERSLGHPQSLKKDERVVVATFLRSFADAICASEEILEKAA